MTTRENVVFFTLNESEDSIRQKIATHALSKFPVCDGVIDRVIGYVDTRDILVQLLNRQSRFQLNESSIRTVLIIPDTLTLSELLDRFRATKETFAVVINEYALVVGVVTLSDGSTPVADMKRVLELDALPRKTTTRRRRGS